MGYILLNKDLNRVRIKSEHCFMYSGNFEVLDIKSIENSLNHAVVYKSKLKARLDAWLYNSVVYRTIDIPIILRWYKIHGDVVVNNT